MPLSANAALSKDKTTGKSVTLQHRHFAFIASVIADIPAPVRKQMANIFCNACYGTNPNFDAERFIRACNIEAAELELHNKQYHRDYCGET